MRRHEDLKKAFSEAYDLHMEEIYRYFAYRLTDRERAKELVQETFMRAWTYAAGGKEIKALRPFLFTTAGNLFKNELRDRRPTISLEALIEASGREPEETEATPEEDAEARLVVRSLEQLDEASQEVLKLRFFDGLTSREIGQALGEQETTVAVRIHRALKKLKALHQPTP